MQSGTQNTSIMRPLPLYASYWYLIGPAFCIALQLYVNYRFGLTALVGNATFPDVICLLSCIVLVVYIVLSHRSKVEDKHSELAFVSCGAGFISMVALEAYPPSDFFAIAGCVGALLFSLYFMTQLLLWLEVFICHDNILNLVYFLLASALSIAVCWFLMGLDGARLICALALIVFLSTIFLKKALDSTPRLKNLPSSDSPSSNDSLLIFRSGSMLAITFFFGLGFMYTTSFMSLERFHSQFDWTAAIYALLLCMLVLALAGRVRISALYYLSIPLIMTGVILALLGRETAFSPYKFNEVGFFTYIVFIAVLYCALGHERNIKTIKSSCMLIMGLYLGIFAGRQLFAAIETFAPIQAKAVLEASVAIAIVLVLVTCTMIGLHIVENVISTELSHPRFTHITAYESREYARHIASIYDLSEREEQIVSLMLV